MMHGMSFSFSFIISISCVVATTMQEGIRQRALMRSHQEMHKVQAEVDATVKQMRENMTLEKALLMLQPSQNATYLVASLMQMDHPRHSVRHRGHGSHFLGLANHQKTPAQSQARDLINEMLTTVMTNIDTTHQECKGTFEESCSMMEYIRGDIDALSAQFAEANAKVLQAEAEISEAEEKLPKLYEDLRQNKEMCDHKKQILEGEIKVVMDDRAVIDQVLVLANCGDTSFMQNSSLTNMSQAATPDLSLVSCPDCHGGTMVRFKHPTLATKMSKIKTKSLQQQVLQALAGMAQASGHQSPNLPPPGTFDPPENPCSGISYHDVDYSTTGCTMRTNPDCDDLREKFLGIQIAMKELHEQKLDEMTELETDCFNTQRTISAMIERTSTVLAQYQTELAYATQSVQRTQSQAAAKKTQHASYSKDMLDARDGCTNTLKKFEAEKCQLEKIRTEVYTKLSSSADAWFQDCVVSDWASGGCSVACGGGIEKLTRTIVTGSAGTGGGGVKCPPLYAQQECNKHECPVDCVESEWSGWSKCSADCDGGIKLRTRDISTHPKNRGMPCGEVTETEECNMQNCDPDCQLFDWTEWTSCSKACDRGHRHRLRFVQTAAIGSGECPAEYSTERYVEEECNAEPCIVEASLTEPMKCTAKVDVVVLVDGSGSLGDNAFAAEQAFVKNFGKSLEGAEARMGIILFSGPRTWGQYFACSEDPNMSLSDAMLKDTCGLEVVSPLTSEIAGLIADKTGKIDSMNYPRKTTFTSGALRLAKVHLDRRDSNRSAERIVVVITDGKPIDPTRTQDAADALKAAGIRVVAVPIYNLGMGMGDSASKSVE